MKLFSKNLSKSSLYLRYFLFIMLAIFLFCFLVAFLGILTQSDWLIGLSAFSIIGFLILSFYAAASGFILYGIASILRGQTFIKKNPVLNVPMTTKTVGIYAQVWGVAYAIIGFIFLFLLMAGTYAAFCTDSLNYWCSVFYFTTVPWRLFSKSVDILPWFWSHLDIVVTIIGIATVTISAKMHSVHKKKANRHPK